MCHSSKKSVSKCFYCNTQNPKSFRGVKEMAMVMSSVYKSKEGTWARLHTLSDKKVMLDSGGTQELYL